MEIGKTLYVTNRKEWRSWLAKNYNKEKEIWLVYYRKSSGKPRIPYNDAVEEALCYGWIDSNLKGINEEKFAQRFSPRKQASTLSEANKERIRQLIKQKKMTAAGLNAVAKVFNLSKDRAEQLTIAPDVLKALKADKQAWENFQRGMYFILIPSIVSTLSRLLVIVRTCQILFLYRTIRKDFCFLLERFYTPH